MRNLNLAAALGIAVPVGVEVLAEVGVALEEPGMLLERLARIKRRRQMIMNIMPDDGFVL